MLLTLLSAIHGDKQQNERDWVLNEFKTGKSPIMVATDVASRGIGMTLSKILPSAFPQSSPSRLCARLVALRGPSMRSVIVCVYYLDALSRHLVFHLTLVMLSAGAQKRVY